MAVSAGGTRRPQEMSPATQRAWVEGQRRETARAVQASGSAGIHSRHEPETTTWHVGRGPEKVGSYAVRTKGTAAESGKDTRQGSTTRKVTG